MKKIFFYLAVVIISFCLQSRYCHAQTYQRMMATSGTDTLMCSYATITHMGIDTVTDSNLDNGCYDWVPYACALITDPNRTQASGSYSFAFSQPITRLKIVLGVIDLNDTASFYINGSHYPISPASIHPFLNCPNWAGASTMTTNANGDIIMGAHTSVGELDINYPAGITTFTFSAISNIYPSTCGCSGISMGLWVCEGPLISSQPGNVTVCAGSSTSFTVVSGGGNLSYQWQVNTGSGYANVVNNATYSNATTNTLGIANASSGLATNNYRCVISGCNGDTVISNPAHMTVTVIPSAISGNSPVMVCNGSNAVLNANSGTGYTYQWQRNGTNILGATGQSYTASLAGDYTVLVTSSGCTSSPSNVITIDTVTAITGTCNPCTVFGGAPFTVLNGGNYTTANFTSGGNYFVNGDIRLTGSLFGDTIKNAYILVDKKWKITIDSATRICFDGCHIFGCQYMWQGIELMANHDSTKTGRISLFNSTLIEDAIVGINAHSSHRNNLGYTLDFRGGILNKNNTAVSIMHDTIPNGQYSILSTVFSCRNLSTAYNSWPSFSTLHSTVSTNGYTAPYRIDSAYAVTTCKDGTISAYGILLAGVGNSHFGTYNSISIGDESGGSQNIFDNMDSAGVHGVNACINSYNNAFIKNRDGIYASGHFSACFPTDNFFATLQAVTTDGRYNNRFYDCVNAIETDGLYDLNVQKAYISSNHTTATYGNSTLTTRGSYGVKASAQSCRSVNLSYDTIINITNGIVYNALLNPVGQFNNTVIRHNLINAVANGLSYNLSAHPNRYVSSAIQTLNVSAPFMTGGIGNVNVDSNWMKNVYRGIYTTNSKGGATALNNNIWLVPDSAHYAQFGIWHANCMFDTVFDNPNIHGIGILTSTNPDSVRAIYISASAPYVHCNYEDSVGRGFEFSGDCTGTVWVTNYLEHNKDGYVLSNNGIIGQQGSSSEASGNQWNGTWTGNFWTHPINTSNPMNSVLYVNNGSTTYPQAPYNGGPFTISTIYDASFGSIVVTGSSPVSCPVRPAHFNVQNLENVSTANLMFSAKNTAVNNWISQLQLWQYLQLDSTYTDSSGILRIFYHNARNSRFGALTEMENQLNKPDYGGFVSRLKTKLTANPQQIGHIIIADSTEADTVVNNYLRFYQILASYLDTSMRSTDTADLIYLAGLCPDMNGNVVYQARALYAFVFHDNVIFDDEVCNPDSSGTRRGESMAVSGGQHYSIYPNPSDGNITILQAVEDKRLVAAEIFNAEGKSIFRRQVLFIGKRYPLNLDGIVPGVYVLQLRDADGNNFMLKFIVNQ